MIKLTIRVDTRRVKVAGQHVEVYRIKVGRLRASVTSKSDVKPAIVAMASYYLSRF